MLEFFQALRDPDIAFLRYALYAGLLAGIAFGIIGSYVVVKRISYLAGAIAHCVLGGIGAALYLQQVHGLAWADPMLGALFSALTAALILGLVSIYAHEREDTVISALWVLGMAIGIILIAKTPGYTDPMSYLFGNILMITSADVWVVLVLDVIIVALSIVFYNRLQALCFDEEFARLRGISTRFLYLLLLVLTALTIVLLVRIVGIIMVVALLSLPAAIAGQFCGRLWQMMLTAAGLSMVCIAGGLYISYSLDLPGGATIVLLTGALYLACFGIKALRR
jgi:zinc transport system permease protein